MPCPNAFSTASLAPVRRDRFIMFFLLLRGHSEVEKIVHWMPEILLAAKIAFRGLGNRCMPE